jgi:hypothetical protein
LGFFAWVSLESEQLSSEFLSQNQNAI